MKKSGRGQVLNTRLATLFLFAQVSAAVTAVRRLSAEIATGHTARYYQKTDDERKTSAVVPHKWAGVKQDKAVLSWIWDNKFVGAGLIIIPRKLNEITQAAVGGDSPAFEVTPHMASFNLHPFILSGLGCPIGKLNPKPRFVRASSADILCRRALRP